jgi:hypothetical protein
MTSDEENHATTAAPRDTEIPSSGGGVKTFILCFVSACLFVLWIYSAYSSLNDDNHPIRWFLFYLFHALIAAAFVAAKCFCGSSGGGLGTPILFVATALCIWSFALVIKSAIDVSNTPKGGDSEGGNAPQFNNREEKVLNLSGAALTLASAIYHIVAVKCCM